LQDGQVIRVSERIAAAQVLDSLEQQLLQELQAERVDVAAAAGVEDDSSIPEGEDVAETGFVDEAGELRRPWCPATRILEHREMVRRSCA
jgi:protein TilB